MKIQIVAFEKGITRPCLRKNIWENMCETSVTAQWSISSVPVTWRIWPISLDLSVYLMVCDRHFIISIVYLLLSRWQLEFCVCSCKVITALANWKKSRLITIEVIKKTFLCSSSWVTNLKFGWMNWKRIWKEIKWSFSWGAPLLWFFIPLHSFVNTFNFVYLTLTVLHWCVDS